MTTLRDVPGSGIDFPVVDYESHPAFAGLAVAPAETSRRVDLLIEEIDALLADARAGERRCPRRTLERLFVAEVDRRLEELSRVAGSAVDAYPAEVSALDAALTDARGRLFEQAIYSNEKRAYAPRRPATPASHAVAEEVGERGVCLRRVPREQRTALEGQLAPFRREADALRRQEPRGRHQVLLPERGPHRALIEAILEESGILRGLEDYQRHPLELAYCALELSHEGQTWWHEPYSGDRARTVETAYFHTDHAYGIPKAMLYLSDVGDDQGPFCYIPGSHRWRRSTTRAQLIKALDFARSQAWTGEGPRVGSYRPHVRLAEFRRAFMRQPLALRASTHFGDDLPDGSALSEELLARQWVGLSEDTWSSGAADCIAFDGEAGIHRGGLVRAGERYALQIGLRQPARRSATRSLVRGGERFLRKRVRDPLRAWFSAPEGRR